MSESVPSGAPGLGLLGLKRIRTLKHRRTRATKLLEEAIVAEYEARRYSVDEIAAAAGMSRQGVHALVKRRQR